ncbi:ribokinase [Microbacterium thalassium]|uniref:ribokinase n=1 Tax=Microbacterium TaxID=33882 RepID=UPI00166048A9|nr:ribokinase [Microbacterium thalassium]
MKIAVVGSVNMDIVARVPRVPGPGETLLARGVSRSGGGKGANQAVAAARAGGATVAFVGAVGADQDGEALRAGLERDGIDVSGLVSSGEPTGTALISVADDGENAIVVIAGANAERGPLTARQRALVAEADVVIAQLEIPVARVLEASALRSPDSLFVLNASPSEPFSDARAGDRLLEAADILVVNEHELRDIAGGSLDLDAALDRLAHRVHAVVLTLGAEGSLIARGDERRRIPSFQADAVDTTGAGDTFCGVFAAALPAGRAALDIDTLARAATSAAAAASLAVGRPGAQDAVPTAAELAEFMKEVA